MLDIQNYLDEREADTIQQISHDLRQCGIRPIASDQEKLDRMNELFKERAKQVVHQKLAILKAADERESYLESECYALV